MPSRRIAILPHLKRFFSPAAPVFLHTAKTSTQSESPPALLPDGEKLWVPVFGRVPMFADDPFVGSSQRAITDAAKVDMATVSVLPPPCGK